MTNTVLKIAAIVIILVMIASVGVYATIGLRGKFSSSSKSTSTTSYTKNSQGASIFKTPLLNGTVLTYAWKISYINNTITTPKKSNMTLVLKVTGINGPWIKGTLSVGNESQSVDFPYASVFIPKEMLGKNTIFVPVYTGLGRSCVELKLVGSTEVNGKNAFIYSGSISQLGYVINMTLYYDKTNGLLLKMDSAMYIIPLLNVYVKGNITMTLSSVERGNGTELSMIIPNSFKCWSETSSDLRLVATGVYKLVNGTLKTSSDVELKDSINNFAMVAVLDKECPHCMRFWPILLEASKDTKTQIYVVVVSQGEIMTEDIYDLAYNVLMKPLIKQGSVGFPFFGVYKNGTLVTYKLGEQSLESLESFILSAESHIAK